MTPPPTAAAAARFARHWWRRALLLRHPLATYRPRSTLVTSSTEVPRARYPAVDAHTHLGRWLPRSGKWAEPDPVALVETMRTANVAAAVNLDGRWGRELEENLDRYDRRFPGRFATFCQLDWSVLRAPGSAATLVTSLERAQRAGARGLKVWKNLGFDVRDHTGALVLPDDPRLGDVWQAAGELGLPIMIHTGDPLAFYQPVDRHNERLEELVLHPEWSLVGRDVPPLARLLDSLEAAIAAHPETTWIAAHVGCHAENLDWVDRMLRSYPNLAIDLSGRLPELGRQPRAARRLIMAHPERVLFGTDDFPVDAARYATWFRFLETADEHFPYAPVDRQHAGRWHIAGLDLPDGVLRRLYRDNALRLVPGLDVPEHAVSS